MKAQSETVPDETKEACVILTMRAMLIQYMKKTGLTFEEAFLQFARSKTYQAIFDLSTGIWREGPVYFQGWYEDELNNKF